MKLPATIFVCLLLLLVAGVREALGQTNGFASHTLVGVNNDGQLTFTPVPAGSHVLAMERRVICFEIYSQTSGHLGHTDFGPDWPYVSQCLLDNSVLAPGTNWIVATVVSFAMFPDSYTMTTNLVTNILSVASVANYTVSAPAGDMVTYYTKTNLAQSAWLPMTVPNPSSFPCSESARFFNLDLSTNLGTQIEFDRGTTVTGQPVN